ncbi:hypothetical protein EHV15_34750 [Paenibacillus oralis]|uniref:Uncharacterized protein n=1 Tax=Paenibacillus oralis TaxID=2490856 RepID=A0A3P3T9M3_9BACL|nr:hypothetical protein [Paenibacillus oralis]RRJ54755.1 hypothetical protein EHV15_34750 [Paenibacillus oralis]
MKVIDVLIELLETGKKIFGSGECELVTSALGTEDEALRTFVQLINQIVRYDRSETIYAYFEGKINQNNALLQLVIDEPKEPMTDSLATLVDTESNKRRKGKVISIQSKRGRKSIYNKNTCIQALRTASEHLGNRFSRMDYVNFTKQQKGFPSADTIAKHIGKNTTSWVKILSFAGIDCNANKVAK